MDIIDKFNNGSRGVIYTIELEPNYLVDVAVSYADAVVYTMQHEDGSTVYGASGHDETYPGYIYDENRAINLVRDVEIYMFEDGLIVDENAECIDAYLWATDNLINRLCTQMGPAFDIESVDDINFYSIYNLRTQQINITGTYMTSCDGHFNEEQKEFTLDLSSEESKTLMIAMNAYCMQRYRKSCLECVNDIRAEENLPLLDIPLNTKPSLSHQIHSASSKSLSSDPDQSKLVIQNR